MLQLIIILVLIKSVQAQDLFDLIDYDPNIALAAAGMGLGFFGGLGLYLIRLRAAAELSNISTQTSGSHESFSIDLTTGDSCLMEDVMISVEFLPSSPSSSSNGQKNQHSTPE
ncbi:putative transmembrane protein [Gregarina niphandrodes]|uniref:Transmembrane protein n=1 Tax=Gregarina niphandrodes TaxID=110365 RepID=A0A023B9B9_GRENI|nr:putative transmembrane protein [Gregarina niphandrodes]EZG72709.1 putative transmembrane protein [Gregarina niphandrodes]|eukprot:XP_011129767.1 putative transmembrane protein [Gregarina niphandrodes]